MTSSGILRRPIILNPQSSSYDEPSKESHIVRLTQVEGHIRWFPGWKFRKNNKTQLRVADPDIRTTTNEKCWEMVMADRQCETFTE